MKIIIKQGGLKHTLDLQNVNNVSSELGSCYIAFDNDDKRLEFTNEIMSKGFRLIGVMHNKLGYIVYFGKCDLIVEIKHS